MNRNTKSSPCPICGGAKTDKQGIGKRCWGFESDGWVHCTREELAGPIVFNEKSNAFPHKIGGPCDCGTEHAPSVNGNGHKPQAKKTKCYCYELTDETGKLIAKKFRQEFSDGSKDFWVQPKGLDARSLPLYGLADLLKLPKESQVIVVEGEKKADALKSLGLNVVGIVCGAPNIPWKKSIEPLKGHLVYLWADNDEPGQSSMTKMATALREFKVKALFIKWDEALKKQDCADFVEAGGKLEDVLLLMMKAGISAGDWEEPIPLDTLTYPEFPVGALPEWLANWVSGISEEMQTPPDLAAMLALSVISASVAKKYRVNIKQNWEEPLNLMMVVALPPGERKSAVFAEAIKPILAYEYDHAKEWHTQYQLKKVEYELAEKRLQSTVKGAVDAEQPDMAKVNDAAVAFAALKKPVLPRLYTDDVTPEKLAIMLAEQNGKMALFSAEGGIFTTLAGRYADGLPSMEIVLKSHGGDPVRVDRVNRESNLINSPALTMGLSVQPGVLAGLGEKKEFMSHGLIARFLYAVPKSKVGNRKVNTEGIAQAVKDKYSLCLRLLLARPDIMDERGEIAPTMIRLSREAAELFTAHQSDIEERLRLDGDLCMLGGWGSKLMGAVGRISAILHLAEHSLSPEGVPIPEIQEETISKAQAIGDYLIAHVKAAFGIIGNYAAPEAVRILKWIKEKEIAVFSRRDAYRAMYGHMNVISEIDGPIKLLEEFGYIKEVEAQRKSGKGRPPGAKFNVFPGLF